MAVALFCEYIVIAVQCDPSKGRWAVRDTCKQKPVKGWPTAGKGVLSRLCCVGPARRTQDREGYLVSLDELQSDIDA